VSSFWSWEEEMGYCCTEKSVKRACKVSWWVWLVNNERIWDGEERKWKRERRKENFLVISKYITEVVCNTRKQKLLS
jgi:hypothetical protein